MEPWDQFQILLLINRNKKIQAVLVQFDNETTGEDTKKQVCTNT